VKIEARKRQAELNWLNRDAAVLPAHVQEASAHIDPKKGEAAAMPLG
jgi:hypothetical protein